MMQFTHQNLNKDFLSIDKTKEKNDQFKDFFSIVEVKYEREKEQKKINSETKLEGIPNKQLSVNSNASK